MLNLGFIEQVRFLDDLQEKHAFLDSLFSLYKRERTNSQKEWGDGYWDGWFTPYDGGDGTRLSRKKHGAMVPRVEMFDMGDRGALQILVCTKQQLREILGTNILSDFLRDVESIMVLLEDGTWFREDLQ